MATNINGDTGIDKIQPGTVEAADIPDSTITGAKLADATVSAAKLDTTYLTPTGDGSLLTGIASGAWTVVAEGTDTSYASTLSLAGLGSYKHLLLYANVESNGTLSSGSRIGFRAGNGAYHNTGYYGQTLGWDTPAAYVRGETTSNTAYQTLHAPSFAPGIKRGNGASIQMYITNNTYPTFLWLFGNAGEWNSTSPTDTNNYHCNGASYMNYNNTIDRFQIYFVSITGRFTEYLLLGR